MVVVQLYDKVGKEHFTNVELPYPPRSEDVIELNGFAYYIESFRPRRWRYVDHIGWCLKLCTTKLKVENAQSKANEEGSLPAETPQKHENRPPRPLGVAGRDRP